MAYQNVIADTAAEPDPGMDLIYRALMQGTAIRLQKELDRHQPRQQEPKP